MVVQLVDQQVENSKHASYCGGAVSLILLVEIIGLANVVMTVSQLIVVAGSQLIVGADS